MPANTQERVEKQSSPLLRGAARTLIRFTQITPLRGKGNYACLRAADVKEGKAVFPQANEELNRFWDFFEFHDEEFARRVVTGHDIVDLGFGYGGRTVAWARYFNPRSIVGVEVYPNLIPLAEDFARHEGEERCRFVLGEQRSIPLPDESADVVISYDVLEHVASPSITLTEIHRVLRPGGHALVVFPPYDGVVAHHLTYVTRLPGIHWLFPAEALVSAVNDVLAKNPSFNTKRQPPPQPSHNGSRLCLPGLNGLTSSEFLSMLEGFEMHNLRQTPILSHYRVLGAVGTGINAALMKLNDTVRDALSFNLSCVLKKVGPRSNL